MKYTPNEVILDNMQRGIALKSKYSNRTSASAIANKQSIQKAQDLLKSEFTTDTAKAMYSELVKLEPKCNFTQKMYDGGPSEEVIKFYAYGGSAGLAWSRLVLKQEGILKSYTKDISTEETLAKNKDALGSVPVIKALQEEKRIATFVVLEPQDDDGMTTDLHGDWYDAETVAKSCYNFNQHCQKSNLFHMVDTDGYTFLESYILPVDGIIGDRFIKKGTWLATIHVPEQPEHEWIWTGIKDGTFNGLSIQCLASTESIE